MAVVVAADFETVKEEAAAAVASVGFAGKCECGVVAVAVVAALKWDFRNLAAGAEINSYEADDY